MAAVQQPTYTDKKWWTSETVAVVTGANKGIGKEIARLLAEQGLTVVATARNVELGKAAVADIIAAAGPGSRVVFHRLDLDDVASHQELKDWLIKEYGGLSILVNNAAIAYFGDVFGPQELGITLATNYYGTSQLTEALLPLIKEKEGRVVTVSSRAGQMAILKTEGLKQRFLTSQTRGDIDALVGEFVALVESGDNEALAASDWPRSMYGVSKLAINAYCQLVARQVAPQGIAVAMCCPGWCLTDLSGWKGNKTAAEGADTPVWLALQHSDDALSNTGLLWADRVQVAL